MITLRSMALLGAVLLAQPGAAQFINLGPDLLPVEEAFALSSQLDDSQLQFTIDIADGYYLYRDRLFVRTLAGPQAGELQLPQGRVINDQFFGEIATYRDAVSFTAPVDRRAPGGDLLVEVISQGCADVGVCYPPRVVQLAFAASGGPGQLVASDAGPVVVAGVDAVAAVGALNAADVIAVDAPEDNISGLQAILAGASLWVIAVAFFNAGLLLAFTPCVLPMIPIAMAVTTKGARTGSGRSMVLGATYVLGMAVVYTALGVLVAGSGGVFLTGLLQNTLLQVALATLFFALAALAWREKGFNLLPAGINNRLARFQGQPGTIPTAAAAGAVAALVVSPCVAAPLVGALLFIASTGDTATGAAALFSLALGMGVLPFACSAGAASYLPRSGPLGVALRRVFALLLAALGLWVLGPVAPVPVKLLSYGVLGMAGAVVLFMAAMNSARAGRVAAGAGSTFLAVLGTVMLVGGATGGTNELAPLAHLGSGADGRLEFMPVASVVQYETAAAQSPARPALEYYYADWCISCKEIEAAVFNDSEVIAAAGEMSLLKVDLSANDADARSLMMRGELFGPPAVIVRDATGRQVVRLIGNFDKQLLLDALARLS